MGEIKDQTCEKFGVRFFSVDQERVSEISNTSRFSVAPDLLADLKQKHLRTVFTTSSVVMGYIFLQHA